MPTSMHLRTMTNADVPAGMRLKELAGWNQTAADWERFLEASPQGCFVAESEGEVRAASSTASPSAGSAGKLDSCQEAGCLSQSRATALV